MAILESHPPSLLASDEPQAWQLEREQGASPFFLICDHASCRVPRSLGDLGLPPEELQRHIGWDIGAAAVARMLSEALDATLVMQVYSRLVIDCNRPPGTSESIVKRSERTSIPGNVLVNLTDAAQREREIFQPYHRCIREQLDARLARGQPSVLIAVHSFTPVYLDQQRPWAVGMLYNRDARLAKVLGAALEAEDGLVVGYNQPYDVSDETDYSIPEHGERRLLPHVELEIRQDLIADQTGQQQWAMRLARLLPPLLEILIEP